MSELETSAAKAIDKLSGAADQLAAKMAELAQQYGPEAIDAGLAVARIEAAQGIVKGFVFLIVSAVFSFICYKLTKIGFNLARIYKLPETSYSAPDGTWQIAVGICAGVLASITGITFVVALSDIWNWVGIFEPKLWIAHRLLDGVL